jgi:hypothetical protein
VAAGFVDEATVPCRVVPAAAIVALVMAFPLLVAGVAGGRVVSDGACHSRAQSDSSAPATVKDEAEANDRDTCMTDLTDGAGK